MVVGQSVGDYFPIFRSLASAPHGRPAEVVRTPWSSSSKNPAKVSASAVKSAGAQTRSNPFMINTVPLSLKVFPIERISDGKLSPPLFKAVTLKLQTTPEGITV